MNRKIFLSFSILIFIIAACAGAYFYARFEINRQNAANLNLTDAKAVRSLVGNFGRALKNVSLLAPTAADDIANSYGNYLIPALLTAWENDPSQALGELTSSPWPDRIEISAVKQLGSDTYEVSGNIIEVTSMEVTQGGVAARRPVDLTVVETGGRWLIASVTAGPGTVIQNGGSIDNNKGITGL